MVQLRFDAVTESNSPLLAHEPIFAKAANTKMCLFLLPKRNRLFVIRVAYPR